MKLLKNSRPLETYGDDIDIFAKGLQRTQYLYTYLGKLPKKKQTKLTLVKDIKNGNSSN